MGYNPHSVTFFYFLSKPYVVLRGSETAPTQYKLVQKSLGNVETKSAGIILAISGGFLSLVLNNQIAESLLKAEEEEYAILSREVAIKEQEIDLDLVEQRTLKLHYAHQASSV